MRILSYGKVKPRTMICNCCDAKYEYVPRDIEVWRPGTQHSKNYVRCPACGNVNWVNVMLIKHDKYRVFKED